MFFQFFGNYFRLTSDSCCLFSIESKSSVNTSRVILLFTYLEFFKQFVSKGKFNLKQLEIGNYLADWCGLFLKKTRRYPADFRILIFSRPSFHQVVARILRIQYVHELILDERQESGASILQITRREIAIGTISIGFFGHYFQIFAARWGRRS